MIRMNRCLYSPIVRGLGASVNSSLPYSRGALNASVSVLNNTVFLYFRGHDKNNVKSIMVWQRVLSNFIIDGKNWYQPDGNPVIEPTSGGADSKGCLNPTTCVFDGKIYMYYVGIDNSDVSKILLATSSDGITFTKQGATNLPGHGGVFVVDDTVYAVFNNGVQSTGGYDLWLSHSSNGTDFSTPTRIIGVSGESVWDGKSIVTCRCYYKKPYAYMFYAASEDFADYNEGFGLARSHEDSDFLVWEKHPDNPIYLRGGSGSWDSAGLWSPSLLHLKNRGLVFYEGVGIDSANPGGTDENECRDTPYYKYDEKSFSSVGVGELNSFDYENVWRSSFPVGKYLLRNVATGMYVSCEDRQTEIVNNVFPQIVLTKEPNETSTWNVSKSTRGAFAVFKSKSNLAISVFDGNYGTQTNAKIGLTNFDGTRNLSLFMLYEKENNIFSIQSRRSGLFFASYGSSSCDGVYLNQELEFNSPYQLFEFIKLDS